MAKKKIPKPNINKLIDSVLKNIDAVKCGERVDLDYLVSFQVGLAIGKGLAPLLNSEDHKAGFASGIQSYFAFDIDNKVASDKDPPLKKSDPEDEIDLPF